ncbi:hypothetical protein [Pararhodobacter sp.]|uniref:hypothetical protein n=1 Tax=Pararhodobacter sp. TaxID=2127056 RepID=UPI002FDE9D00
MDDFCNHACRQGRDCPARHVTETRAARNRLAIYAAWLLLIAAVVFTIFAPSIAATLAEPLAGRPD